MRTRRLVKFFRWDENTRDAVVLGEGTRINPSTSRAQLAADARGRYSTDPDLYVRSRVTNPSTVRAWVGFEANVVHVLAGGVQVTSVGFRLSDGDDEWWWNGSAWEVNPSAGEWNTEEEVADHIAAFTPRTLAVVVNLATSDARYTPELVEVKVAWASSIESFQEDIIYRSLIRLLRERLRPIGRAELVVPAGGASSFALSSLGIETGYDVVDVDSVFNLTDDPDMVDDVFGSYNANTKTVTLSASQAAASKLRVNFVYRPAVAVKAHQDGIVELEKLPVVVLAALDLQDASERAGEDVVVNKRTNAAIVVPAPLQGDLVFTLRTVCEKDIDNHRLSDELKRFFSNAPTLRSTGLDEFYTLRLVDEFTAAGDPAQTGLFEQEAAAQIDGVCYWNRADYDDHAATRMVMRLGGEQNPVNVTG